MLNKINFLSIWLYSLFFIIQHCAFHFTIWLSKGDKKCYIYFLERSKIVVAWSQYLNKMLGYSLSNDAVSCTEGILSQTEHHHNILRCSFFRRGTQLRSWVMLSTPAQRGLFVWHRKCAVFHKLIFFHLLKMNIREKNHV